MDDLQKFKVLIYEFLWKQEATLTDSIESARLCMEFNEHDSYFIIKYFEAVRKYEDFRVFQRYMIELLKY